MALSLNGSTGYISIPSGWTATQPAASLAFWINATALPSGYAGLSQNAGLTTNLYLKSTGKLANYGWGPSGDPMTNSPVFATGQWYHIAHMFNSAGSEMYVNGISIGTGSGGSTNLTGAIAHGDDINVGGRFFNGKFADIGHWNIRLSASEVSDLALGKRAQFVRPNNLIRYVPCDGYNTLRDVARSTIVSVIGGVVLAADPPLLIKRQLPRIMPAISPYATRSPGITFKAAWAAQSNVPVIGAGTY